MAWNKSSAIVQDGDLVQLLGKRHKSHFLLVKGGEVFHSHRGTLKHDEIIGKPWGTTLVSHTGSPFFLMQPSLADVIRETRRVTQIMYPKDIGFILMTMGVGPGLRVLEAGTGSGGMTTALAYMVGNEGRVYSYERRPEMQKLAIENLERIDLAERVTFKIGDILDGFDETNIDALFLDVPNAYDYLGQVKAALKPGGFFSTIMPTTPQVVMLLEQLHHHKFAFVEVCEVILRYYKPDYQRFRPVDRMVAHTGYLVFARAVTEFFDPDMDEDATPAKPSEGLTGEAG